MTTETTVVPMTTGTTAAATPAAMMNIMETLAADGRFNTLVAALKAAQLDGTLSGPGPLTVFAPTDDAFKKLPGGTVDSLLKNPQNSYLNKMLTYHVVNKELKAADIMRLGSINTVQGQSLLIDVSNGMIFVNGDAEVITTDIVTSNGVIHVIDTVLNHHHREQQPGSQKIFHIIKESRIYPPLFDDVCSLVNQFQSRFLLSKCPGRHRMLRITKSKKSPTLKN